MNDDQRRLMNRLQQGFPLVPSPWRALAEELDLEEAALRQQVDDWLADGTLTRFGPMFDVEVLGGAFTLAAMVVPEPRFEAVHQLLDGLPEVAHNYRREHALNMWFVLACDSPAAVTRSLEHIEAVTGLVVMNFPKEVTYHVGLHFPV
ncbi:MAG: Lrp/AsnC family transcriptional regulator [Pseudomonadales bacterium]|nr:Lrp/AsnC family transcriptional regulator [Pseudomonadales bacterium]